MKQIFGLKSAATSAVKIAVLAGCLGLVAGCDQRSDKAASERLTDILENGSDPDRLTKAEERLAKILEADNSVGALNDRFGNFEESGDGRYPIEALVAAAMERNTDIRRAAENLNLRDVERLNAIFGYLPQVSLSAQQDDISQNVISSDNAVFQLGEAQYPVTVFSVTLKQPIFDLGRIFNIQYANNARTQAEVEYVQAVREVAYQVFDAALVAEQASSRARLLRQRQGIVGQQIESSDALIDAGLDIGIEASSLRADRSRTRSDASLETARLAQTLGNLSRMTGVAVQGVQPFRPERGVFGTERRLSAEEAVSVAMDANPQIMVAALDVVGSDLARRAAIGRDFSPVIEAYATLEQETREASRFGGGSETEDQTIGVAITIPLFNARGNGYETLTANVKRRTSALDYYGLKRQVEAEIRALHARMGQLSSAIGQASQAASAESRALADERNKLDSGESVEQAVALRELRVNSARDRRTFQQYEYLRAWARLKYLMGADLAKSQ